MGCGFLFSFLSFHIPVSPVSVVDGMGFGRGGMGVDGGLGVGGLFVCGFGEGLEGLGDGVSVLGKDRERAGKRNQLDRGQEWNRRGER